jgi:hypothetical protein
MSTRGVRELPVGIPKDLRDFLQDLQGQVVSLRGTQQPLPTPTNFKVTPMAFGNLLQWTRSLGADYYEVLWAATANNTQANVQGVGDSAQWFDNVGQAAVKRYYWVRAKKYLGNTSLLTPGLSGTTLASGTGVNPPTPPPASKILVIDMQTGHVIPYALVHGRGSDQP